jgi:hypothetical protein
MTTEIPPTRATFGDQERPDPEVLTRPRRTPARARVSWARFCAVRGLYSSMLCDWRRRRDKGLIAVDRKRGRTPTQSEVRENADLKR